jgi:hypothetical protein
MSQGVEQFPSLAGGADETQSLVTSTTFEVAAPGWLCVDAPDEEAALQLVDSVPGFHAELAPGVGTRCEVRIDLRGAGDGRLVTALGRIEHWLDEAGVRTAQVRLDGHRYLLEGRAA